MDRRLRYGLLGVGLLLLLFALLERAYAYPRLARIPLGVYSVPVAEGIGSYFDAGRLEMVREARLRSTRVVKGDREAGGPQVAVWDMLLDTVDLDTGRRISRLRERVVFDRVTGRPVRCCGESPRHDGIVLNFPSGTRQASYPLWDPVAARSAPATFVREELVDGLRTYRFQQRVRGARIRSVELPGSLTGQPGAIAAFVVLDGDKTLWVEPVTGRIIKGQDHAHQTVKDASGVTYLTALDVTLTDTDDTVAGNVAAARDDLDRLRLAGVVLPASAGLLGVLLLGAGLLGPSARRPPPAPGGPRPGRTLWVVAPEDGGSGGLEPSPPVDGGSGGLEPSPPEDGATERLRSGG
jgi:hypothetical protein